MSAQHGKQRIGGNSDGPLREFAIQPLQVLLTSSPELKLTAINGIEPATLHKPGRSIE